MDWQEDPGFQRRRKRTPHGSDKYSSGFRRFVVLLFVGVLVSYAAWGWLHSEKPWGSGGQTAGVYVLAAVVIAVLGHRLYV